MKTNYTPLEITLEVKFKPMNVLLDRILVSTFWNIFKEAMKPYIMLVYLLGMICLNYILLIVILLVLICALVIKLTKSIL